MYFREWYDGEMYLGSGNPSWWRYFVNDTYTSFCIKTGWYRHSFCNPSLNIDNNFSNQINFVKKEICSFEKQNSFHKTDERIIFLADFYCKYDIGEILYDPIEYEYELEEYLLVEAHIKGIQCEKQIPKILGAGVPDRKLTYPNGKCIYVELKTPTGKLREVQKEYHKKLRNYGEEVRVIWSKDQVDKLLNE